MPNKKRGNANKDEKEKRTDPITARPEAAESRAARLESIEEAIALIDRVNYERHLKYRAFLESLRPLEPRPRAEAWLRYAARTQDEFGEEEAVVYLASRGADISDETEAMIVRWRRAERHAFQGAARDTIIWHADGSHKRLASPLTADEVASQIKDLSHLTLGDFWYVDQNNWTQDAAMLRAVEWCDVGGFDAWWDRFAQNQIADAIRGGAEPIPLVYYLFAIARSPLAIQTARRAWERHLDMLEYPIENREPWRRLLWDRATPRYAEHLEYASCLSFALARIRGDAADKSLLERVGEILVARQNPDGGWSEWATFGSSNTLSTALALHALSVSPVRGRDRAMQRGAAYLWSSQSEFGFWDDRDRRAADAVYLTVLVLDAMSLAEGSPATTLDPLSRPTRAPRPSSGRPGARRFAVSISFPGEARSRVEPIAERLAVIFGQKRILYDRFHQSELARPNLDLHLHDMYEDSQLIVVVLSGDYDRKEWCGIEWRKIRELMNSGERDIMFLRADSRPVRGVMKHDGWLDMSTFTDDELARMIVDRVDAGSQR